MTSPSRTSRCDEIVSLIDACLAEVAEPPGSLLRDDPEAWTPERSTHHWWQHSAAAFLKHQV